MKDSKVDIVVIGNVVKETIFLPEETVGPVLGSPCAYVSLALAKAEKKVGIVTYYGRDIKREMDEEMRLVDKSGCLEYMHTTEDHLIYLEEGKNKAEYFKVAPVINCEAIHEEYLEASTFIICPMDFEVSIEVCEMLHDMEKTVIVDLGGYGGTTSYNHFSIDSNRGHRLINDLCKNSAIIKASRDDLRYIMPNMTVEECTEYLVSRGPQYAVVTMGEDGAVFQEAGKKAKHAASFPLSPEEEREKNVTGAGDVFLSGMIVSLAERPGDMARAVNMGNIAASFALGEKGGCVERRMPTAMMMELRMGGKI